jgi:hypothetical protein
LLAEFQSGSEEGRFIPGMPSTQGGWGLLFESQIGFELALLYLTPFGDDFTIPIPGRFERALDANEKFSYVQTMVRRNGKTLRTFTWNNLLGLPTASVVPQGLPMLVGIATDSLIGKLKLRDTKLIAEVKHHQEEIFREGFETSGIITYKSREGVLLLSRELRVFTWDNEGMLLFDRLTTHQSIDLEWEEAAPLYIVNDEITGNRINIVSGSLEETILGPGEKKQNIVLPNQWVVIEDNILYQVFWGMEKGLVYRDETERKEPSYWKNLRMDKVFIRPNPGKYEADQVVRQYGLYVGLGKGRRWFKINGKAGKFFKGLILIEGKNTLAL